MTLDQALRMTEVLLGLALIQQSAEHLRGDWGERWIFLPRLLLAVALVAGFAVPWVLVLLLGTGLAALHRFQGPYNGGSDRMTLLILVCLTVAACAPTPAAQELALGYIAVQLVLSYAISGWVKIVNPQWRQGRALADVFRFSAYPVAEAFRRFADHPRLLWVGSWGVIGFEMAFPLALMHPWALALMLALAAGFHLANACLFGLNRFFWIWLCAYPSLVWFQTRILG